MPRVRLWNAKRIIKTSQPVPRLLARTISEEGQDNSWESATSPDVVEFVHSARLSYKERLKCLKYPPAYFSKPFKVPNELRKQVYFPDFVVTLMRTPHLPPKYAAFDVPLWFNKLDMKDYLKEIYNVDVLHVRSVVIQSKVDRKKAKDQYTQGQLFRPISKKKMTVELLEPFVWPEEKKDLSPWQNDVFWTGNKAQLEFNRREGGFFKNRPDSTHRKSIAQQAKDLLSGKETWSPTWQQMPATAGTIHPSQPPRMPKPPPPPKQRQQKKKKKQRRTPS